MKKGLFVTILCCYLLSTAIVPLNVGNKWFYYCKYKALREPYNTMDTLFYRQTSTVIKDTLDAGIVKKFITKTFNIPLDSFLTYMSGEYFDLFYPELWYEEGNKFYKEWKIYYEDGACDTVYAEGAFFSRTTYEQQIFMNNYSVQEYVYHTTGTMSGVDGRYITAKNLGVIFDWNCGWGLVSSHTGFRKQILVAAEIDGIYIGDSLAASSIYDQMSVVKTPVLVSNYPNPFNSTTSINFELNHNQPIKLSVYNNCGELVKVLADRQFTLGKHAIPFDAAGLNSGVYFYQLETAGNKSSGKMLMIK